MPGEEIGCVVRIPAWCLEVERARDALVVLRAHGWERARLLDGGGEGVLVHLAGSPIELVSVLERLPGTTPGRDRMLQRLRGELAPPSTPS